MNPRLLSLVFAPFAFGTSAFVFIGLIEPMAADTGRSVASVGQLQTVFALACAIGGPIIARLTSAFDRKRLLILVISTMAAMNLMTALAPSLEMIGAIRFAGGLFAALTLPLSTTIAVSLVDEERRPAAIAAVLAGYTLAFLVGMPVGSVLGDVFGWRASFLFACSISVVAVIILALGAPSGVRAPDTAGQSFAAVLGPDNAKLMAVTMFAFCATFVTVSFIGPVITRASGLTGGNIGAVQTATGIGSILGLAAGVWLAKIPARTALGLLLSVTAVTQALFTVVMFANWGTANLIVLIGIMIAGSGALFATSPIIQNELAKSSGAAATLAFALNGSMIYLGQGLGAAVGGSVIAQFDLAWIGLAGLSVALAALVLIATIRRADT